MPEIRTLAENVGFTEGPVFRQQGDFVFVSIDRGHLYKRSADGLVERLVNTGGGPNGATEGPGGVLYVAQNGGLVPHGAFPTMTGGVQAVTPDGGLHWVTQDQFAPNDLCFGPDGKLYVTDPTRRPELNDGRLWQVDIESGRSELLASVPWYPNGIGFGLDPEVLYVASSGESRLVKFHIDGNRLSREETAFVMPRGHPDGFAFDAEGNVIVGAVGDNPGDRGQIQVWSAAGKLEEVIEPGASRLYTNVAFSDNRELVITDSDGGSILVIDGWPTAPLPLFPFRAST